MRRLFIAMTLISFVSLSVVSVAYSACKGDLNCDGYVDGEDLAIFAADYGSTGCGTCDDVIGRIEKLEDRIAQLEELLQHFTRNGNDIYIDGANLHIRSGSGVTESALNGLGNLIVGYNEERSYSNDRTGSHNIVVGAKHNFSSYGGLVAGYSNTVSGSFASVSGGRYNTASGNWASVSGGDDNTANGNWASVSGGYFNKASGADASVSGGYYNTANGVDASVSGGQYNTASGNWASVTGGYENEAAGETSTVLGWEDVTASNNGNVRPYPCNDVGGWCK